MGKTLWKIVSPKKLSFRKRGSFKTARILSSGGVLPLPSGQVRGHEPSVLPCLFLKDTLCSYRKSMKVYIMERCWKCSEFLRFEHEMDEEDKAADREVEDVFRRFPV